MDWLNRAKQFLGGLFGGAQQAIGQIAGNVAKTVSQAEQNAARTAQQAVQRIIPQAPQLPHFQLPQIRIQAPRVQLPQVQLPQAPKIDLGAVGRALQQTQQQFGRNIGQVAQGVGQFEKTVGQGITGTAQGLNTAFKIATNQQLTPSEQQLVDYTKRINPTVGRMIDTTQQGARMWKENPATAYARANMLGGVGNLIQGTQAITGKQLPKFDTTKAVEDLTSTLAQTPLKNIPGAGVVSDIVHPLVYSAARMADVAQTQEDYSKGLKGLGEMGTDMVNVASTVYSGGLSTQLGKVGLRESLPIMAKLAPRLAASGAGQNILQQLAEGKKINELDPKQIAIAAAAYTGLGLGLPTATKAAGVATKKLMGAFVPTAQAAKVGQALPADKNALVIARTLPEKGALRAQGYTNVQVQFTPKPGQVTPQMQGAIAQNAYKRQAGGLFGPAPKGPVAATADYKALEQTTRDLQDNLIKMRQSGQYTEAQLKPYADNINKLTQQMVDMRTGKLPTIYENVPKSYLEPKQPKIPIKAQERKFTESVRKSPEVSGDVAAAVTGEYTPKANQLLIDKAAKFSTNINKATNDVKAQLDSIPKNSVVSDQTVANAILTAKKQDAMGNFQQASEIYDKLAEKLTEAGRTVQAASLLQRQTPEGLLYSARKMFKKAGVEITPQIEKEIQTNMNLIKAAPMGSETRSFAIAKMQKDLMKHIPQGKLDNLVSLWKGGLLSGFKTQAGNLLSNTTFGVLKLTSNPVSSLADALLSVFTKKRSYTLTGKGLASGGLEGAKKGITTLTTGIDMREITGKGGKFEVPREINFKNKALQTVLGNPTNLVFRGMSAADQPVYFAALKNSLQNQAKAEAINQGLKGQAAKQFIIDAVANPPKNFAELAVKDAEKAVLGSDNALSRVINMVNRPGTNPAFRAIVNTTLPFTKVPSNFLLRTIDYSPLGPIKTILGQVYRKKFDQRALAQAIGEGVTGTGLFAIGTALASQGMLSGDYPKTDQKEQARWKAEGITPNSVKLGDKWVSLNYLGPLGLIFGAGKNLVDARNGNASALEQVSQTIGGFGSGLMQQSFLQGLSGFTSAVNDPATGLNKYLKSQFGSIVPAWINDLANISDNMQRQANTPLQQLQSRIPGLRQNLPVRIDVFGNPLTQAAVTGTETALNPFKPSTMRNTPLTDELDRLKATGKENNVWPTPYDSKDFFGKNTTVTKEQLQQIQGELGPLIQKRWNELINTPTYNNASDAQKAKILKNAKDAVVELYKKDNASKYGQTYTATKGLNPQEKYQQALDKYNQDIALGNISKFEDVTRQKELGKLKIASGFSNDVLDVYGLSGKEIQKLMDNKSIPQDLWNQVLAYGDALVSAGLEKQNKFKDKYGNVYLPGTKVAGTGRKGAGRVKVSLKAPKLKRISITAPKTTAKLSFKTLPKIRQTRTSIKPRKTIKIKTG